MKIESECDRGDKEDSPVNGVNLMNIIREYPAIYDRKSKDHKDKSKKANAWKKVEPRAKFSIMKSHFLQ